MQLLYIPGEWRAGGAPGAWRGVQGPFHMRTGVLSEGMAGSTCSCFDFWVGGGREAGQRLSGKGRGVVSGGKGRIAVTGPGGTGLQGGTGLLGGCALFHIDYESGGSACACRGGPAQGK